jgi:hypothetical protein
VDHDIKEIIEVLSVAWKVGAAVLAAVVGVVGVLLRLAFKLGGDAKEIRAGLQTIQRMKPQVDKIPDIERRTAQNENVISEVSGELKRWIRGSHPFLNGAGGEE